MSIEKGYFVACSYDLYNANDNSNTAIEHAPENAPLQFLFDEGMMLPAFEANLKDLNIGDAFDFVLSPEEAYGEPNPDLLITLDKQIFSTPEGEFDSEIVKIGNMIPMQTADGQRVNGLVKAISEDNVTLDFNHPMAGIPLHFIGKIIDAHMATDNERGYIEAMMHPSGCGCGCGSHDDEEGGCGGGCGGCGGGCC